MVKVKKELHREDFRAHIAVALSDRGTMREKSNAADHPAARPSHLHEEVKVRDATPDERHRGVIEEVLDVHPPPGGEVVGDADIVMLCQGVCKVRADEAGPAGDDVTHEESMIGGG